MSEVSQIVPCPFKVFFLLMLFACVLFLPSFYCFMCFVHVLLMMITLSVYWILPLYGKDRRAAGDRSGTGQGSVRDRSGIGQGLVRDRSGQQVDQIFIVQCGNIVFRKDCLGVFDIIDPENDVG